jgi:hypothetical protein
MLQAERQQQRQGKRDTFVLVGSFGGGQILTAGWDPSWATPAEQDVDDLVEDGLLRYSEPFDRRTRKFDFTRAGRTRARQLERERSGSDDAGPIDLSWPAAASLLEPLIEAYELAGAPELGVPVTALNLNPPPTTGELRELARQDLAEIVELSDQGDFQLRPTARGVRMGRQWPTPETLIDAVILALEREADSTGDDERRGGLRQVADALGGFARDVAVDVVSQQLGRAL